MGRAVEAQSASQAHCRAIYGMSVPLMAATCTLIVTWTMNLQHYLYRELSVTDYEPMAYSNYHPEDISVNAYMDCPSSDTIFPGRRYSFRHQLEDAIPFIGTNVDYDAQNWTLRLFQGLDYPIHHKVLAAGGCEKRWMLQLEFLRHSQPDLTLLRSNKAMGVAPGWNRLLRYMENNVDIPFAIIFNNDMYTPPGALKNLSAEMWTLYNEDPKLCLAHFEPYGFTSFIITRRALRVLGYFDENIYPAYFEDNDMKIRIDRAVDEKLCSPIRKMTSAVLRHGDFNYYVSGTFLQREMAKENPADPKAIEYVQTWDDRIQRGQRDNPRYLESKWGCTVELGGNDEWEKECIFKRPFNRSHLPISWWKLDESRRKCIEGFHSNCTYDMSFVE